ncbi:hypothetical protein ACQ4M4_01065 [Leptolyngbya sp. AN02str]
MATVAHFTQDYAAIGSQHWAIAPTVAHISTIGIRGFRSRNESFLTHRL